MNKIVKPLKPIDENKIILIGHIESQSDFEVIVHLPNSGMILDLKKKDLAYFGVDKEGLRLVEALQIIENFVNSILKE